VAKFSRPRVAIAGAFALALLAGCGGDEGDQTAFCASLREHRADLVGEPPRPGTDAAIARIAMYTELADLAPQQIRGEVDDLGELYERYASLDMESDQAVGEFYIDANADGARAAGAEVTAFAAEHCGVTLAPDGTDSASAAAGDVSATSTS
jgi:hypothetical protein